MAEIVPIEASNTNQEFSVQLDGVEFVLRIQWQDRDESWYIDLLTAALVPLWMGARIAVGVPLLYQFVSASRPAGELMAIDTAGNDEDPGIDDLGVDESKPAAQRYRRVQLIYISASDVAEAGAA